MGKTIRRGSKFINILLFESVIREKIIKLHICNKYGLLLLNVGYY